MINGFNLIIFSLWLISAVADYSQFCYLWQLKEYRKDRFRDFLKSKQGKQFWMQYPLFWRSFIALIMFFWPINDGVLVREIILVVYTVDVLNAIHKFLRKKLLRPHITPKSVAIVGAAACVEGLILLGTHDWAALFLMLILRFFLLSIVVGIFSFPTIWYKKWKIRAARKKLEKFSSVKVIGITGSYGKSSTKEFLSSILAGKYQVIKTPKNINTEIGIAQFILKTDFSACDYFVVEMGAYTKGEIALICSMVRPTYGILTTIAEEHLALFGSIQNIQQAKYELLRALPHTGFAVTNADNAYCMEHLSELSAPYATFGIEEEYHPTALITYTEKQKDFVGICFSLALRGETHTFTAPIVGEHNAQNIAAAVLMAEHIGMSMSDIHTRVSTISAEHGVIRVYKYGMATIVDDTYNSNPRGFRAALAVLASYSGQKKRIVITRGMLELGALSDEKHEEVAGEIAFSADRLIIISPDSAEALERGAVKKYGITVEKIFDSDQLVRLVQTLKNQDVIVLLENRLPHAVVEEIKNHSSYAPLT